MVKTTCIHVGPWCSKLHSTVSRSPWAIVLTMTLKAVNICLLLRSGRLWNWPTYFDLLILTTSVFCNNDLLFEIPVSIETQSYNWPNVDETFFFHWPSHRHLYNLLIQRAYIFPKFQYQYQCLYTWLVFIPSWVSERSWKAQCIGACGSQRSLKTIYSKLRQYHAVCMWRGSSIMSVGVVKFIIRRDNMEEVPHLFEFHHDFCF